MVLIEVGLGALWEGVRMLRRCSFAAIPYLLMIGSIILNCSYADADKKKLLIIHKRKKKKTK